MQRCHGVPRCKAHLVADDILLRSLTFWSAGEACHVAKHHSMKEVKSATRSESGM